MIETLTSIFGTSGLLIGTIVPFLSLTVVVFVHGWALSSGAGAVGVTALDRVRPGLIISATAAERWALRRAARRLRQVRRRHERHQPATDTDTPPCPGRAQIAFQTSHLETGRDSRRACSIPADHRRFAVMFAATAVSFRAVVAGYARQPSCAARQPPGDRFVKSV